MTAVMNLATGSISNAKVDCDEGGLVDKVDDKKETTSIPKRSPSPTSLYFSPAWLLQS
jgi:hypothetical protein